MKPIQNFHPHSVTGKTDDSFVGLKIIGSQIHFYYPESYHFDMESKENNRKHELVHTFLIDLYHVVKTWNRYNHTVDVANLIQEITHHQHEAEKLIND